MSSNGALVACQSGYEGLLARELQALGLSSAGSGPGWVLVPAGDGVLPRLAQSAFASSFLESPVPLQGERVNELAQGVMEFFAASLRGERIEAAWPCQFSGALELTGLGRRVAAVEAAFHELLKKKLGRLAKLATPHRPRLGPARGLFVWFTDFGTLQLARSAVFNGQCRMADDDAAPSRSYLKVEESYAISGAEPAAGETVCDLGAAPGGWSYSAAKRGARVVAVDNGPLKGGALDHPLIDHRRVDAFGFRPGNGETFDWLFSDMLEDPHKVLRSIAGPWLEHGWCRRFVINLKFGRVEPIALLQDLRAPDSPFVAHAASLRILHLYHDREEFTVTGTRAA